MFERITAKYRAKRRATSYTERHGDTHPPPSVALFRYVWPFWLFKDASRGDMYTRAAAYRYNREMRVHLPVYLLRWTVGSALTLGIAQQVAALSSGTALPDVFVVAAAMIGMLFATEICLLLVMAYVYVYLSHHAY